MSQEGGLTSWSLPPPSPQRSQMLLFPGVSISVSSYPTPRRLWASPQPSSIALSTPTPAPTLPVKFQIPCLNANFRSSSASPQPRLTFSEPKHKKRAFCLHKDRFKRITHLDHKLKKMYLLCVGQYVRDSREDSLLTLPLGGSRDGYVARV